MAGSFPWIPEDVDLERPNAARVYDYYLGGAHNVAADRDLARAVIAEAPEVIDIVRYNRRFLRRSVEFLARSGIRQFLDLGSGIPTAGNVHEVVQNIDPSCRVVYVDNEWVAVAHSQLLLHGVANATVIQQDLRDVDAVVNAPETQRMLDFDQPIAVLMYAVLHYMPDGENPGGIVAAYRELSAPGSYLAISHAAFDPSEERLVKAKNLYRNSTTPLCMRTADEIRGLLRGYELVEPGLVYTQAWRPDDEVPDHPPKAMFYAAVGKRRD